jgi:hypothetical protein
MNTYEITWQETMLKKVVVKGNTREEAWELFRNNKGKPGRGKHLATSVPAIQIVSEGERNA